MGDACSRCKGTGEIWRGYPPRIPCPTCHGTRSAGRLMSGLFDDEIQPSDTIWAVPLGWRADNEGHCRSCGAQVLWCFTPAGKKAPIDRDGKSHFSTCPDAAQWRKRP